LYLTVSGLPAIIIQLVFVVVFSMPVWLGARIVGAKHSTLLRAVFSLMLGTIGVAFCIFLTGLLAFLLAPLIPVGLQVYSWNLVSLSYCVVTCGTERLRGHGLLPWRVGRWAHLTREWHYGLKQRLKVIDALVRPVGERWGRRLGLRRRAC